MAAVSSQVLALWTSEQIEGTQWVLLRDVAVDACRVRLKGKSEDERLELIEKNLPFIAEHLRNDRASMLADGIVPKYEIDEEERPYVRRCGDEYPEILKQLRTRDPFEFERLCAEILSKLGARSEVTGKTWDGGVDFLAIDFDFVPDGLPTPNACRAAVIGQAKRYKDGNAVKESDLRKFVGGALRRRHELIRHQRISPLSPVVYAFWTTSSFESNARAFGRAMGIWYMEGSTLAKYCNDLGLQHFVANLRPDIR